MPRSNDECKARRNHLPKRGNKIKIENIQTKMSQTVANRAFYCTIISFEIRQHQFWGTPF